MRPRVFFLATPQLLASICRILEIHLGSSGLRAPHQEVLSPSGELMRRSLGTEVSRYT